MSIQTRLKRRITRSTDHSSKHSSNFFTAALKRLSKTKKKLKTKSKASTSSLDTSSSSKSSCSSHCEPVVRSSLFEKFQLIKTPEKCCSSKDCETAETACSSKNCETTETACNLKDCETAETACNLKDCETAETVCSSNDCETAETACSSKDCETACSSNDCETAETACSSNDCETAETACSSKDCRTPDRDGCKLEQGQDKHDSKKLQQQTREAVSKYLCHAPIKVEDTKCGLTELDAMQPAYSGEESHSEVSVNFNEVPTMWDPMEMETSISEPEITATRSGIKREPPEAANVGIKLEPSEAIHVEVKLEPSEVAHVGIKLEPSEQSKITSFSQQIEKYAKQLLKDVRDRINGLTLKSSNTRENSGKRRERKPRKKIKKLVETLPILNKTPAYNIKEISSDYLESFLDSLEVSDCEEDTAFTDNFPAQPMGSNIEFCINPVDLVQNKNSCSFNDTLFEEGYLSKPSPDLQSVCPWPTLDRCPLSSLVERKNGNIYVIKNQKRARKDERSVPRKDERSVLGDSKKRKRFSSMLSKAGPPPKYITPMEYHTRMMEHKRYMEQRQWQNITHYQDYENYYHDVAPSKIPDYVYNNQSRGDNTSSNNQLLSYLANRSSLFTADLWDRIDGMAEDTPAPIRPLSPFTVDHFFYQFYFFSGAYQQRTKRRKRNRLLQYFQPELYIMPSQPLLHMRQQHPLFRFYPGDRRRKKEPVPGPSKLSGAQGKSSGAAQGSAALSDKVPSLPDVPARAANVLDKSPELKSVESVYSYKRRIS